MGGLFGVVSKEDCIADLFYGTDYHSHLGTMRGGMVVKNGDGFKRSIHNITNAQFRSKFEEDLPKFHGNSGIGCISDYEDQPLIIGSHLGMYAIVTVGKVDNLDALVSGTYEQGVAHFSEMRGNEVNQTELVANLVNQGSTFLEGIQKAQDVIQGSCSILILTEDGIYAARDRLGRTPVTIGEKPGVLAATLETCALPNLDYEIVRYLGPGEIVRLTEEGMELLAPPGDKMQICSFLWVYYGYPASHYENINVEQVRNRCGNWLSDRDNVEVDIVAGIPDSGTAHAQGYANRAKVPYRRPFVKYTPTWPRSFMPQEQRVRELVARMKLIPIRENMQGQRILFCEDSIVRGTQLKDIIQRVFACGAKEAHMRPACPPLIYGCKYLNFSRSKSEMDLAARRAIRELEGDDIQDFSEYADCTTDKYAAMIERIRMRLGLTSLQYQRLDDLITAIGMPKEKLCTYCWDGCEG